MKTPFEWIRTHSVSVDGADDGLGKLGNLLPGTEEIGLVRFRKSLVLHFLDVGSGWEGGRSAEADGWSRFMEIRTTRDAREGDFPPDWIGGVAFTR